MYDRNALLMIRQSPLSKTPTNLPAIPGVTVDEEVPKPLVLFSVHGAKFKVAFIFIAFFVLSEQRIQTRSPFVLYFSKYFVFSSDDDPELFEMDQ